MSPCLYPAGLDLTTMSTSDPSPSQTLRVKINQDQWVAWVLEIAMKKPTENCPADGVLLNQEKDIVYSVSFPLRSIMKSFSLQPFKTSCETPCNSFLH